MKKTVILFLALCSWLGAFAQQSRIAELFPQQRHRSPIPNWSYQEYQRFHFGFILAANHMNFDLRTPEDFINDTLFGIQTRGTIGFTVGAIFNWSIHDFLDLRTGTTISLGSRNLYYTLRLQNQFRNERKTMHSTTMDIPLEIKWSGMRDRSLRPYIIGGFRYSLDMLSARRQRAEQSDDLRDIVLRLERDDFLLTLGGGFSFYAPFGNRISIEIKMAFGLRDMLIREDNLFTNGIDRLTSRNLLIAINLE